MNLDIFIRTIPNLRKTGVSFKDVTPLLGDAGAFCYCIDELAKLCQGLNLDRIGVFDARGFIFGSALAYKLRVPLFPIRKKGKLPYTIIGVEYALEYGTD